MIDHMITFQQTKQKHYPPTQLQYQLNIDVSTKMIFIYIGIDHTATVHDKDPI